MLQKKKRKRKEEIKKKRKEKSSSPFPHFLDADVTCMLWTNYFKRVRNYKLVGIVATL